MEDKDHLHQALEPLGNGNVRTENGKLTYPLRHSVPLSSVALGSAPLRGSLEEAHSVLLLKTLFAP